MAASVLPGGASAGASQRIGNLQNNALDRVPQALTVSPASSGVSGSSATATMANRPALAPAAPAYVAPAAAPTAAPAVTATGARLSTAQVRGLFAAPAALAPVTALAEAPAPIAATVMTDKQISDIDRLHNDLAATELENTRTLIPFKWGVRVPTAALAPGGEGKLAEFTLAGITPGSKLVVNRVQASLIKSTHGGRMGLSLVDLTGASPLTWDDGTPTPAYHAEVPSMLEGADRDVTVYERSKPVDAYTLLHYGNTSEQQLKAEIDVDKLSSEHRIHFNSTLAGMLARKNPDALAAARPMTSPAGEQYMAFANDEIVKQAIAAICTKINDPAVIASAVPADKFQIHLVPTDDAGVPDMLQKVGAQIDSPFATVTLIGTIDAYVLHPKH